MASWIARLVSLVEVLTGTQGGVLCVYGGGGGGGRGPREMCAGGGVREWRGGELYTTLHCHQQNYFCIKMGSVDSHF